MTDVTDEPAGGESPAHALSSHLPPAPVVYPSPPCDASTPAEPAEPAEVQLDAPARRPRRPRRGAPSPSTAPAPAGAERPAAPPPSPAELVTRWGCSPGAAEVAAVRMAQGCPEAVAVLPRARKAGETWKAGTGPDNLRAALALDPWAARLRWDAFRGRPELRGARPDAPWARWTDEAATAFRADLDAAFGVAWAPEDVRAAVRVQAQTRPHHEVRAYLDGLRWDGEPRARSWLHRHLGAPDTALMAEVGARWLVSAVARVMEPGCRIEGMLLLAGPQGAGKGWALETLAGAPWHCNAALRLDGDKDGSILLNGRWVYVLDELAGMKGATLEAVKAYLTRTHEVYRPPYGIEPVEVPRQTVFAGTVNPEEGGRFLADRTGNRRFWLVPVGRSQARPVDIGALEAERDQLWAEAAYLYRRAALDGASRTWAWHLPAELHLDLAETQDDAQGEVDAWASLVAEWCDRRRRYAAEDGEDGPAALRFRTIDAFDALDGVFGRKVGEVTQRDARRMAVCLQSAGARSVVRRVDGHPVKLWTLEPAPAGA